MNKHNNGTNNSHSNQWTKQLVEWYETKKIMVSSYYSIKDTLKSKIFNYFLDGLENVLDQLPLKLSIKMYNSSSISNSG